MKKHLNTTIIAGLFLILCNQLTAQKLQPSSSPYLDSCFQAQMEIDHIPGISACIIKDGQLRWIGAYGYANFELDIPVDTSTLFMLASVSKTITVTALMQLWEEGKFGLDEDINDYLPFEVKHPIDSLIPITFRMLCTHTSSIKDNWSLMPNYFGGDSPIPLGEYLFDYLNPDGANYNLNLNFYTSQPPGTNYNYSNIGAALIGYLVEVMNDSSFSFSYQTQQYIFEPLQMNETAWFLSELDTMHIAMPYSWNGSVYTPYGHYGYSDYPAGQLRTSVDQLANFLLCYMKGGTYLGQQILQESTVHEILSPQVPQIEPGQGLIWHSVMALDKLWWFHTGGHLGVTTLNAFCPEGDYGHIILANRSNVDIDALGYALYIYAEDSIQVHCLEEGITFTTQEEIDNFQNNYPYCTEIEGDMTIEGDEITNLNGLNVITSIGGDLIINHSESLISLTGLENIAAIEGTLQINDNYSLSALSGLDNISPASIFDLFIYNNYSLTTCEVESICDYLSAPSGIVSIHDNASGCNSQQEVEEACDTVTIVNELGSLNTFSISPNPLNPITLIQYTLHQNSPVILEILDLSGRLIVSFVNEIQQQGEQRIEFNTTELPAGVYFCTLKTNEGLQTTKMIKL